MKLGEFIKLLAGLWFAAGDLASMPDLDVPDNLAADVERIAAECRKLQACEPSGQYLLPLDVLKS